MIRLGYWMRLGKRTGSKGKCSPKENGFGMELIEKGFKKSEIGVIPKIGRHRPY